MKTMWIVVLSALGLVSQVVAAPVELYERVLRHVDADGWVDYAVIAAQPMDLMAYTDALAMVDLAQMDEDERLATLINAYNAFTLRLIVERFDGGKLMSITALDGGKTWDVKRWTLGGEVVSLNHIEHSMIRGQFDEPRIHWALVCAAYSCPPLRSEAYRAEKLEQQLASQEAYVLNFKHDRFIQRDGNTVRVSKLFDWYGSDFGEWKRYIAERVQVPTDVEWGFIEYRWPLNDVRNR